MVIWGSAPQFINTCFPMVVRLPGNETVTRFWQLANTLSPRVVTPSGTTISIKAMHPLKALVEITKTVPLEKLVWASRKDLDNEIKTIHHRTKDPHLAGC